MPEKWTYGKEGEAWPVQPGDVWMVGPHTFVCSNLMVDEHLDRWLEAHATAGDLMYADPPWNQSNINSFHTKAGLPPAEHQWSDVYQRIIDLAYRLDVPLWLEGGDRQAGQVQAMLTADTYAGWNLHVTSFPITYYRTRPATIHYAGPITPTCDPTGLDDGLDHETVGTGASIIPATVLRSYAPPATVIDPCAGRGLTSRCAHLTGWASINNELHPARMSAAINRLHLITNHQPERVHHD